MTVSFWARIGPKMISKLLHFYKKKMGFLNFFLISLFTRDTEREAGHRQREKQAPRTPGSRPEPKTDAQPLSHASVP